MSVTNLCLIKGKNSCQVTPEPERVLRDKTCSLVLSLNVDGRASLSDSAVKEKE